MVDRESVYTPHLENTNIAEIACRVAHYHLEGDGADAVARIADAAGVSRYELCAAVLALELVRHYHLLPHPRLDASDSLTHFDRKMPVGSNADGSRHHVFLSYRRHDSRDIAGLLKQCGDANLGPDSVFMDVFDMPYGTSYATNIAAVIQDCAALVLLVTPEWFDADGASSWSRFQATTDPVRLELEAAHSNGIPVVVLGTGGAAWDPPSIVPSHIRSLEIARQIVLNNIAISVEDADAVFTACQEISGGGLEFLRLPDMDADTRLHVRQLVLAVSHMMRVLSSASGGRESLLHAMAEDVDGTSLYSESMVSLWQRSFGREHVSAEAETDGSLYSFLCQLVTMVYTEFTADRLEELAAEFDSDDEKQLSRAELLGMSTPGLLHRSFQLHVRGRRHLQWRGHIAQAERVLRTLGAKQSFTKILFVDSNCSSTPYLTRLHDAMYRQFGERYVCARVAGDIEEINASLGIILLPIGHSGGKSDAIDIAGDVLNADVPCIPLVLPGEEFPDLLTCSSVYQAAYRFTIFEMRDDPLFASDMDRLVNECRMATQLPQGFSPVLVPETIPHGLALPIGTLLEAAGIISRFWLAYATERHLIREHNVAALELAYPVVSIWCQYFEIDTAEAPDFSELRASLGLTNTDRDEHA